MDERSLCGASRPPQTQPPRNGSRACHRSALAMVIAALASALVTPWSGPSTWAAPTAASKAPAGGADGGLVVDAGCGAYLAPRADAKWGHLLNHPPKKILTKIVNKHNLIIRCRLLPNAVQT